MTYMDIKEVVKLLERRAYIFTCSYTTAWENWLTDEEKQGLSYEEVLDYMEKEKAED